MKNQPGAGLALVAGAVLCTTAFAAAPLSGKKMLFIDSYRQGYAWSHGITEGVQKTLDGTGVTLKVHRMDTKRNKTEEGKVAAAEQAKAEIESFQPDVVIAADDNAPST